jgi:hypothetical protein
MTARLGNHQKWIVRPAHRAALHDVLTKALGAKPVSPPGAAMDIFEFAGEAFVGVEVDAEALDEAQARKGTWLEFHVDDPEASARALDALDVRRVEYADKTHVYFQAPGGPIFRLTHR